VSAETDTPGGAVSAEKAASEPTPTVPHSQQTASHPAGSAMPDGGVPVTERPEALVGAAFAGGVLAAFLLRKIVG
jgi:hypothetical protein